MRPVELHMKNIGPYLDETIDFSSLDNMFLIKGDTGAGKTFIFDAVTFALYGKLRGNRQGHESDFKSRYAEDSDESFVEFKFDANGKRYFISRTVPFKYENRNGKISRKTSEVYFCELAQGGRKAFGGKAGEIDGKIQDIIGLSSDEFAQIILLPQGKFAEFLHKNSKERAETLKTLFPVEFYTDITQRIKEKFDGENYKLKVLEGNISSMEDGRDFSDARNRIAENEKKIAMLEKAEKEAVGKLSSIASKKASLEHELRDSREFEENQKSLDELLKRKPDFDALQKKISDAEKALALKEFISAAENAENAESSAQKNLESALSLKNSAEKAFDGLEQKKDEMKSLSEKNKAAEVSLQVLDRKIDEAKELPSLVQAEKSLEKDIEENKSGVELVKSRLDDEKSPLGGKTAVEITGELNESLKGLREKKNLLENESAESKRRDKAMQEKLAAEENLSKAMSRIEDERKKLERTAATVEALENAEKEQDMKNRAYAVSLFLKPNSPCPVCGSLSHPSPAEKPAGLLDYAEQIRTHKENLESIRDLISSLNENKSALKQKIESSGAVLSEIKTNRKTEEIDLELGKVSGEIVSLEEKLRRVQKCAENVAGLEKRLEELNEKASKTKEKYLETKTRREALEKSLGEPLEDVAIKRDSLFKELSSGKAAYEKWESAHKNAETSAEKARATADEARKNALDAAEKLSAAKQTLSKKVAESVFETVADAKSALLDTDEIESARKRYEKYSENVKSLSDAVQNAKSKSLAPSQEILGKLEICRKDEDDTNGRLSEIKKTLEDIKTSNTKFKNDFEKLEAAKADHERLEKEIAPLSLLNSDLSGANPLKLRFETWALGMYFEQVVSFASRRFFDISGGRFSFELNSGKAAGNNMSGLDLKVFDSHSGKYSDPAELSGGETFEASISLALALTDVVQNSSGGIQLDSLFIDEGFGTLDPETLEKAMSVLTELGETKMIGMISHVSEMEDFPDIKSVIKVNKTNLGSSVTVETR